MSFVRFVWCSEEACGQFDSSCVGMHGGTKQKEKTNPDETMTCLRLRRCSVASRRISASSSMCDSAAMSSSKEGATILCGAVVMVLYSGSAGDGTIRENYQPHNLTHSPHPLPAGSIHTPQLAAPSAAAEVTTRSQQSRSSLVFRMVCF